MPQLEQPPREQVLDLSLRFIASRCAGEARDVKGHEGACLRSRAQRRNDVYHVNFERLRGVPPLPFVSLDESPERRHDTHHVSFDSR